MRTRNRTTTKWQQEWDAEAITFQWTKKLISEIKNWVERKHGEINYYLTQLLSGHGRFNSYLCRFNIKDNDHCIYCGQTATSEYTVLKCSRWNSIRKKATDTIGQVVTAAN